MFSTLRSNIKAVKENEPAGACFSNAARLRVYGHVSISGHRLKPFEAVLTPVLVGRRQTFSFAFHVNRSNFKSSFADSFLADFFEMALPVAILVRSIDVYVRTQHHENSSLEKSSQRLTLVFRQYSLSTASEFEPSTSLASR